MPRMGFEPTIAAFERAKAFHDLYLKLLEITITNLSIDAVLTTTRT
jgi:hypothetical protein